MKSFFPFPWNMLTLPGFVFLTTAFVVRLALVIKTGSADDLQGLDAFWIFSRGFFWDGVVLSCIFWPATLYLSLVPWKVLNSDSHRVALCALFFFGTFALFFVSAAEWFFWDEFGVRFNFIAVDYLIYTQEVVENILESYPVGRIVGALALISGATAFCFRKTFFKRRNNPLDFSSRIRTGGLVLGACLILPILSHRVQADWSENAIQNEWSKNGIYTFIEAFRHNVLDYATFYPTQDSKLVLEHMRRKLQAPGARFISEEPENLVRRIEGHGVEKQRNVFLCVIESLSAEYLGVFGHPDRLTPCLDRLSGESLFFRRMYATGTRTVRGLEAIALSLPPTPGASIIRRPDNANLFSVGWVFQDKGYDTRFVYGGFGYFDNMNYFFSNNGFEIRDRASLSSKEIRFANAWGVCDEDLYDMALSDADRSFSAHKPFFSLLLSTSNHRPYTYPEGRIDLLPGTRAGAVKYTDYAIGRFLEQAKTKPWFENTVFVFVADHCSSTSGKSEVPVRKYHIPCWIYAPGIVKTQAVDTLCSQMDLSPTLLGILDFSYTSLFFGVDVLRTPPGRALLGTYQTLGLLEGDNLILLKPKKNVKNYTLSYTDLLRKEEVVKPTYCDPERLSDAIAYYQGASELWKTRKLCRDIL